MGTDLQNSDKLFEHPPFDVEPKYHKLKKFIEETILKEYEVGSKVPSERELAKRFNMNQTTVNKAISILVQEGYLYREQGKGTFVANYNKFNVNNSLSTRMIGVIVPSIEGGIYPKLVRGIEAGANKIGYNIILCNDENEYKKQYFYSRDMLARGVEGVILVPVQRSRSSIGNLRVVKKLIQNNIKVVLVDRYLKEIETDYVITDNFQGAYNLATYLIKLGHKRIGFIRDVLTTTVEDRLNGYRKAFIDNGIKVDERLIVGGKEIKENIGYYYVEKLMRLPNPPTAVMCIEDLAAAGALKKLKEMGIKVPEEVSVTGYDDLDFAVNLAPPLTTVRQPIYEMGKKALELLIDKIRNKDNTQIYKITLELELVIRDSCMPLISEK